MVFRVQPAVVLKGKDYYFNKNWGTHGHLPITAAVLVKSCTQTNCGANCAMADCIHAKGANVSIASDSNATSGVAPDFLVATTVTTDATKTSTFTGTP
jgi:hypothetical protein